MDVWEQGEIIILENDGKRRENSNRREKSSRIDVDRKGDTVESMGIGSKSIPILTPCHTIQKRIQ